MPGPIVSERIPVLEGTEEDVRRRLKKMCIQLERIFTQLESSAMVVNVCVMALREQNAEQDEDIASMLTRFADNNIDKQLNKLAKVIDKLGGHTRYFFDDDENPVGAAMNYGAEENE